VLDRHSAIGSFYPEARYEGEVTFILSIGSIDDQLSLFNKKDQERFSIDLWQIAYRGKGSSAIEAFNEF
jgi:hypothetical protein